MSWKDFREQANQDFESSKILMKEGDFGNSAYLLQQYAEKYVKAVIFKFNLFNGTPRDLGHLPLIALWGELWARGENKMKSSRNPIAKQRWSEFQKIMKEIHSFFKSAKGALMETIWKDSLKIPLTEKENNELISLMNNLEQKIKPMWSKIGQDYDELFHNKIKPLIKLMRKKEKKLLQDFLDFMYEYIKLEKIEEWKLTPKEIDVIKTPEEISTTLELFLKKINPRANNLFSKDDLVLIILLSWIFTFSSSILKTFPHESIGRYPREINGVSSRLLYQQQSDALVQLSNEVEMACKKLDEMLPEK